MTTLVKGKNGHLYLSPMDRIAAWSEHQDRGYKTPCHVVVKRSLGTRGYAHISINGLRHTVHRVVWEHHHGPVPDGLELDHLCRQHDCHEVTHLEAVTHAENVRRGLAGEVARQRAAAITHCPKGHEYTPENTKMHPHYRSGHMCRRCRQCARDWANKTHARKRAARLAAAAAACLALMCGVAQAKPSSPTPEIQYPKSPCNLANRMNVEIIDGMLWECSCSRLLLGYQCDWFLIAGVETPSAESRRIIRRAKAKHHRVTIIHALPAVTA